MLGKDGGEWRCTAPALWNSLYFSSRTMQRRRDGHRAGRQGTALAPTRQSQPTALHFPPDSNRFNDMDVQAPPLEVPP